MSPRAGPSRLSARAMLTIAAVSLVVGNLIAAAAIYGSGADGLRHVTWGWALGGEIGGVVAVSITYAILLTASRRRSSGAPPGRVVAAVPVLVSLGPAYLIGGASLAAAIGWPFASIATWVVLAAWFEAP